jgi:murein L,D-transpeptidase YcbB/YkuD
MAERVRQILLSLERWRWLPDNLGHRPIFVNVPEYKLFAFEDDGQGGYRLDLKMNVIVGESYPRHRTPLFHSAMRYIVFAPYWHVPRSIVRRELYEKLKENPDYLVRHNFDIVNRNGLREDPSQMDEEVLTALWRGSLKLRQRPGNRNALGEVKFIFPNDYSVYLHGTPKKGLFAKDKRALSHGCVRVADAAQLAAHVLSQESGWDRARVDALIASGKNRRVNLSVPLDVYLVYGTAVAEPDGTVRFFHDVYGYDDRLSQALERAGSDAPAI